MLNYKHLYYMREVATAGSLTRASERLHLTPQTLSGQISLLEESLGTDLFKRQGRNLELTEAGQVALQYANEIFQLGEALEQILQQLPKGRAQLFRVGVSDLVPKSIAYRLLQPAMLMNKKIRIVCTEGKLSDLLAELAVHRMELVIADSPMPSYMNVKGFSHKLGSSGISFFASPDLKASLVGEFPACLDGAALLMLSEGAAIRSKLLSWFHSQHVKPMIVGEFDDSALMQAFGFAGTGVFIAPTALEETLEKEGRVEVIGRSCEIYENFYAISIERKITHSAIKAITEHAQGWLH